MGRATQIMDYLTRPPEVIDQRFMLFHYTHIDITPQLQKIRVTLKLYNRKRNP